MSLLSLPLRIFFFRERPEKREFKNILEKINASSFPSNHSARVVFLFLFFIGIFPELIFVLFFGIITLIVLFSRIALKFHHPEDVIGGSLLAVIIFEILSRIFF
jgi:membrane-associated phospholipid phosphatase